MKAVVQRVQQASVNVNGFCHSSIKNGLLIYVCIEKGDTSALVRKLAKKIISLRVFADSDAKMNLDLTQISGEILLVSQFTLSWSGSKGNRPNFFDSLEPHLAKNLYEELIENLQSTYDSNKIKSGVFNADMQIASINDGPATFALTFA